MVPKNQGEVRVQFHQDPASAATATFAVWYKAIGTMQSVSFSPVGSLRPELLQENRGVAIFDLNGDGRADLHLAGQPNPDTLGLDFVSDLPGGQVFRMRTVPSGPPPRRIPFGPAARRSELLPRAGVNLAPPGSRVRPTSMPGEPDLEPDLRAIPFTLSR